MRGRFVVWCGLLILLAVRPAAAAVRVLFENADVRVSEITIKAGTKETGFHKHSVPYTFYVLKGGTAKVRVENGSATQVEYRAGEAGYGEAESHAVDNVGSTDIVIVLVDLKTARAAGVR